MKLIATKLRNANITKVDLVDEGANQGAAIKLYKAKAATNPVKEGDEDKGMHWIEKIGKAIGEAIKSAIEASADVIQLNKAAIMFNRAKKETKVSSLFDRNWWDYTSALRKSIESILTDDDLEDDEKEEKITQSLEEFSTTVIALLFDTDFQDEIEKSGKKIAAERLARMKEAHQTLAAIIAEVESENDDEQGVGKSRQTNTEKEEIDTMKIDKSKMTPEERALLEALEKKYGTNDDPQNSAGAGAGIGNTTQPEGGAGIAKSLEDANATIEKLSKRLDEIQEKTDKAELMEIAKKYEVCGEKPEELVNTLYALKKAGNQAAYDAMIATLDKAVTLVEKSGLFREIGKSGQGGGTGDAWDQIVAKAQEIRKSKPELTEAQAIDLACQQHPELVVDYEQNR